MTCKIQNLTHRLVSLRDNSGQTWHLPPGVTLDLMDAEVMDNAKIAKLVARGSLGYNPERCNPRRCDPRQARRPLPAHQNAADG